MTGTYLPRPTGVDNPSQTERLTDDASRMSLKTARTRWSLARPESFFHQGLVNRQLGACEGRRAVELNSEKTVL